MFQDDLVQGTIYVHCHKYTHLLGTVKEPLYKCMHRLDSVENSIFAATTA